MSEFIKKLFSRLKFFLPISTSILFVITILAFLSIRSTTISINQLLQKSLELEVDAIYKMFEREYQIKNDAVKNHLKVLHYIFYSYNFEVSNDTINIKVANQITNKTHFVAINKWYLNNDFLIENHFLVDTLKALVGGTATVFQKIDSGYLRISTNVLNTDNQRAIGTFITNNSMVVKTIEQGKTYYGRAFVVNDWYITAYEPLYHKNKLIGMLYVGYKEKNLDQLRDIINNIQIGKSGFVYAIDTFANVIIHPNNEGENWSDSLIIKQIINQRNGTIRFNCVKNNYTKIISFKYFKEFNLIVAAQIIQENEIEQIRAKLIKNSIIIAIISISVLLIFIFIITYKN
ncbi:MAG: Cache 3/Cache 2 fusion domain-containing protein, partial [Bacteroidales bacterium]|nr:Cache 3/Cache 2 fusion domain-containing protein [Bacteroidales bacterium]